MPLKIRTEKPPRYKNYRDYKQYLRAEFDYSCAYCNLFESEIGSSKFFHIDHYRPQKKFPKKINDYFNLFYSCPDCNSSKKNYWASVLQRLLDQFILNPCDHDYDVHFDRSNVEWLAKSKVARWNIDALRLNSQIKLQKREEREDCRKWIKELEEEDRIMKNLLLDQSDKEIKIKIESKLRDIEKRINILKQRITKRAD